jgi:hypothetical protein
MSEEHKAALAQGRAEGRVVKAYLHALQAHQPRRGRRRTKESIENRLHAIEAELDSADPLRRLHLAQERLNLLSELDASSDGADLADLEARFVGVAAGYSARKGITYAAWRQIGVPASVLKEAGIKRSA